MYETFSLVEREFPAGELTIEFETAHAPGQVREKRTEHMTTANTTVDRSAAAKKGAETRKANAAKEAAAKAHALTVAKLTGNKTAAKAVANDEPKYDFSKGAAAITAQVTADLNAEKAKAPKPQLVKAPKASKAAKGDALSSAMKLALQGLKKGSKLTVTKYEDGALARWGWLKRGTEDSVRVSMRKLNPFVKVASQNAEEVVYALNATGEEALKKAA